MTGESITIATTYLVGFSPQNIFSEVVGRVSVLLGRSQRRSAGHYELGSPILTGLLFGEPGKEIIDRLSLLHRGVDRRKK